VKPGVRWPGGTVPLLGCLLTIGSNLCGRDNRSPRPASVREERPRRCRLQLLCAPARRRQRQRCSPRRWAASRPRPPTRAKHSGTRPHRRPAHTTAIWCHRRAPPRRHHLQFLRKRLGLISASSAAASSAPRIKGPSPNALL
jgi:hypothetical protein